jgi:transcriptional regulator with XRE-family HTH domain
MSIDEKMLLQDKILGILIRDARQAAGKTQKECAAFLKMSAGMLSDIEYGERPISLPELEILAYLLDVPVEHFLGNQLLETVEKKPLPVKELVILRNRVIGVLLRQARMAAGMTQEECGKAIDVSSSRISAYEHGQMAVPLSELETLAEILKVPLETFLDNENNPIAKMARQDRALEQLGHLPEEMQTFLLDPLNTDYLHTAMHLSMVPADQLRNIAETLLEITY